MEAAIALPPEKWTRRVLSVQILIVGTRFRSTYRAIWRFAPLFVPAFDEFGVLPTIVPIPERYWRDVLLLRDDLNARFVFQQGVLLYGRASEEQRI
jgi:hypothetical protein